MVIFLLIIKFISFPDLSFLLNSFSTADVHRICKKDMHVVGSQWLEDSIESSQRLREDAYGIKIEGLEDLNVAEW